MIQQVFPVSKVVEMKENMMPLRSMEGTTKITLLIRKMRKKKENTVMHKESRSVREKRSTLAKSSSQSYQRCLS